MRGSLLKTLALNSLSGIQTTGKQNGHVEAAEEVDNTHQSLLFKVASRVKFIVDSPETIWSCLDDCRLKESAERLLSAQLVYRTTKSADKRVI